jgi:hypothetical protein
MVYYHQKAAELLPSGALGLRIPGRLAELSPTERRLQRNHHLGQPHLTKRSEGYWGEPQFTWSIAGLDRRFGTSEFEPSQAIVQTISWLSPSIRNVDMRNTSPPE